MNETKNIAIETNFSSIKDITQVPLAKTITTRNSSGMRKFKKFSKVNDIADLLGVKTLI